MCWNSTTQYWTRYGVTEAGPEEEEYSLSSSYFLIQPYYLVLKLRLSSMEVSLFPCNSGISSISRLSRNPQNYLLLFRINYPRYWPLHTSHPPPDVLFKITWKLISASRNFCHFWGSHFVQRKALSNSKIMKTRA